MAECDLFRYRIMASYVLTLNTSTRRQERSASREIHVLGWSSTLPSSQHQISQYQPSGSPAGSALRLIPGPGFDLNRVASTGY